MRFGIQAEICLSCLIYPVLWIVHTQTHFKTLWKWFSLYVTSHPDIMGEKNECHTGNLSSFTQPVNGRTHSWTQGNVYCGISGDSSRPLLPPPLSFMLPLYLQPQGLGPVITMCLYPACFPNYQLEIVHKAAVKQIKMDSFTLSLAAPSVF